MERLERVGLEDKDIRMLKSIDDSVIKTDNIVNLMIKAHNHGFRSGVNESIRFMTSIQNGEEYK